ncbi:hypothetical protein SAMN05444008_101270 [Cnuella takakiae]|uniref:DoxX protein n=1 Tax=Cnuella takakiae TaxID=1302690 RepID=A0A1M4SXX5_9BACT|nr:hypothetical protein [Cnuella takakiae]OLY90627.1 hypothetical protein BUE76_00925 [Cnuella takakiae]SHE37029.1 hypothetical protein SAMN05444008_101270 [Cnuella takakiae]
MSTVVANQTLLDRPVLPADNPVAGAGSRQPNVGAWKGWQKVLLRISFVFFVFMSLPTDAGWYQHLFTMDWTSLHYRDIYDLARFSSGFSFVGDAIWGNNLLGYANWIITLGVAIALGLVWTVIDRKRRSYNDLYYWLRVIVRYRAGIGIIGFGFTKLLPVQMPYPSEGLLNTDFGDLTAQKIYWLSIGIVPWYQVFAGIVELAAGTFLFFRKTTLLGAILLFGALGDIVYVNFAYDGGVHVYSSYFVLLAAFLMIQDIPVLYDYFIRQRLTIPKSYYPSFQQGWLKATRIGLKAATIFIFLGLLFYLQYVNFRYDPYKQPATKGVAQLRGFYNVTEFRLNNKVIPYSPFDTVRWQEATFEKWSTLTFKVNKPVQLDLSNGGGSPMRDINRTFELTGVGGGRRVFYYDADTVNNLLFLQDKNTASNRRRRVVEGNSSNGDTEAKTKAAAKEPRKSWIPAASLAVIGSEDLKIDERARSTRRTRGIEKESKEKIKRARMVLRYSTTDGSRVILTGVNENKDSIYVVLDRADKKYALSKSTLVAGEY